ncbi:hypothetical protein HMPREF0262_00970 [Clostridium sp. ATCC 29733]|nr:hypothetical protein HMPREF0262_00970 [Clostridium sp. ATCC 29733]
MKYQLLFCGLQEKAAGKKDFWPPHLCTPAPRSGPGRGASF